MARIRCFACGLRCRTAYKFDAPACPECESVDVELAVFAWELPIDDPYWTQAKVEAPPFARRKYGRMQ